MQFFFSFFHVFFFFFTTFVSDVSLKKARFRISGSFQTPWLNDGPGSSCSKQDTEITGFFFSPSINLNLN